MTKWTPEELRAIAGAPATEIWIGTVRSALRHAADLTDAAHTVRDENERLQAERDALRKGERAEAPEPVAWIDLLAEAEAIVRNKPTWKRFIDGTPLSNDIAVWMADFAEAYQPIVQPAPAAQPTLPTEAQIEAWQLLADLVAGLEATHWSSWQTTAHFDSALDAARAALAAKDSDGRP